MNEKGPTYRLGSLNEVNDSQCTKKILQIHKMCMYDWLKNNPKRPKSWFMLILAFEVNYSN